MKRNGTNCASTAPTATGHWTRCWPATAPTVRSTARPTTANVTDPRVSATATCPLWSPSPERPTSRPRPTWSDSSPDSKRRKVKAVLAAVITSTSPNRWSPKTRSVTIQCFSKFSENYWLAGHRKVDVDVILSNCVQMWHRRCFNCAECHRSLDSTNLNDAPDDEIYCAGCYRKKFGPHGVGYGMGAGTLLSF